ncbi:MAG: TonB-dependent receptor plug domain-containing protein [Opitutaceae bacterium]|nr:TonB-dependent receptor plug domain-containing protein [Opitutaceae bacterium]
MFQVIAEAEDEYRAANTTTGTRYSTPVKDLPMQIEVLTEAFIRDVGATDVRQALEYVSGVQLETAVVNSSRDNPENAAMFVRGVTVATTMKDGFQHYLPIDAVTIGRIDIIKGPGGALYGQGNLGGVIQAGSIRAKDRPAVRFGATHGNFGYERTELVLSGPLDAKKRLSLALPIAYQRNESTAMYFKTDNFVFNPALTVQLGPKTTLLLSNESRFNTRASIRGFFLTDNNRAPDGSFYGTIIPGRAGTNRVLTTPNQRDFRFEGPDTYRRQRDYIPTIRIDHVFTRDLQAWIGYNYELSHVKSRDWNIALRNANDASIPLSIRTNPRFLALLRPTFNNAQPQVLDIRPNNIQNDFVTTRPTFKAELYYGFSTGPVQHRLVSGASYGCTTQGTYAPNTNFYFGNTGAPTNAITRAWEELPVDVILSRFRSPTDFATVKRWDSALINQYPQGQHVVSGALPTRSINYFYDRNIYLNLQSTFFKGRFETILGVLDVRNDRQGRVFGADDRLLWAGPAPAGNPAGTPGGVMRPEPVKDQAPSATIVWRPHDHVRLYANAMSAVDPSPAYSAYDGNGEPLEAPVVTNREAGVRFYLFDSKVAFSAAFFDMKRLHNPQNLPGAIQNLTVARSTGATPPPDSARS